MPSSRLQWRALAALGALLLVISVWPLTCAALPIELLTFQSIPSSNRSAAILSNLTNNRQQRTYPNSEMNQYKSEILKIKSEQYSPQLNDDIMHMPMLKTAVLQRKRKKINPNNNRSTSYTIKNYFNAARTIIQKKESTSSSTPQTLHSNDLYLASTAPSSLSVTTHQPVVGLGKLSLNNSLQIRLSQTTMHDDDETIASLSTTQITTSIKLNQNQTVDNNASSHNTQLNSNRNHELRFIVPTMFLNQTIAPSLQTVFPMNDRNYGSKRAQMTTTESIFSRTERSISAQMRSHGRKLASGKRDSNLDRNERSTNFSHITGTSRKIQLLIKNRLLQLLPDGTVNGTQDDGSDYTILQRATVDVGKIRIQGVATCLFLCMDTCGNVYGAKEFTNDCVFNESMLENYNIYASTYHSNSQKIFYLALNKLGQPRKTHLPANKELGKLATYAKSFTFTVAEKRTEDLIARLFGSNHVKHGLKQLCDSGKSLVELVSKKMKNRLKCGGKKLKNKSSPAADSVAERPPKLNGMTKCTEESCQRKKKNHPKSSTLVGRLSTIKTKKPRKNLHGKKGVARNKTKSNKNFFLQSSSSLSAHRTTTFRPHQATTTVNDDDDSSYPLSTEQNEDDVDESTIGTTFVDDEDDDD